MPAYIIGGEEVSSPVPLSLIQRWKLFFLLGPVGSGMRRRGWVVIDGVRVTWSLPPPPAPEPENPYNPDGSPKWQTFKPAEYGLFSTVHPTLQSYQNALAAGEYASREEAVKAFLKGK